MELYINEDVESKLTILKQINRRDEHPGAGKMVLVKCECGTELEKLYSYVKRGRVKSCGPCQRTKHSKDMIAQADVKGRVNKRLSVILKGMKRRCNTTTCDHYYRYGGRGIKVCDEWLADTQAFYTWAENNGYSEEYSIDRIDNDKGYSPDNCRWTSSREQTLNSRTRSDSSTGERCVTPIRGKYQLTIDGKYQGVYDSIEKAVERREELLTDDRLR